MFIELFFELLDGKVRVQEFILESGEQEFKPFLVEEFKLHGQLD